MRKLGILVACVTLSFHPVPAAAMDLKQAALRLATIDSELTSCLRARVQASVILVRALRKCIADARPGDQELRKDLNGWIPSLAGTDPVREDALDVRQALNLLRSFMNQLDAALKYEPAELLPIESDEAFETACLKSRVYPVADLVLPQSALLVGSFCK